jgi:hypothetical protein
MTQAIRIGVFGRVVRWTVRRLEGSRGGMVRTAERREVQLGLTGPHGGQWGGNER